MAAEDFVLVAGFPDRIKNLVDTHIPSATRNDTRRFLWIRDRSDRVGWSVVNEVYRSLKSRRDDGSAGQVHVLAHGDEDSRAHFDRTARKFADTWLWSPSGDLEVVVDFLWPRLNLYNIAAADIDRVHNGNFLVHGDLGRLRVCLHLKGIPPHAIDNRLKQLPQDRLSVHDAPFLGPNEYLLALNSLDYYLFDQPGTYLQQENEIELAEHLFREIRAN